MKMLKKSSIYVFDEDNDELFVVHKASGKTHILNRTARLLLNCCENKELEQAIQIFVNKFDVNESDEDVIRNDAQEKITFFIEEGILIWNEDCEKNE